MVNKAVRREFSYTGITYTLFYALANGFQLLLGVLLAFTAVFSMFTDTFDLNLSMLVEHPLFMMLASMISMYVVAFPVLWLMMRRIKKHPPAKAPLTFKRGFVLFLISMFMMLAGAWIGNLFAYLIETLTGTEIANTTIDTIEALDALPTVILSVLIGPLMEEIMFRKILIDRLRIFGEKKIMVLSAVMFGLFHANLYQLFYAFGLGLVLAYIYMRTGRLRYTYLFHALINLVFGAIPLLFVQPLQAQVEEIAAGNMEALTPAVIAAMCFSLTQYACALAGFVLLIIFARKAYYEPQPYEIPKGLSFRTIYLAPGMIIFMVGHVILIIVTIVMQVLGLA